MVESDSNKVADLAPRTEPPAAQAPASRGTGEPAELRHTPYGIGGAVGASAAVAPRLRTAWLDLYTWAGILVCGMTIIIAFLPIDVKNTPFEIACAIISIVPLIALKRRSYLGWLANWLVLSLITAWLVVPTVAELGWRPGAVIGGIGLGLFWFVPNAVYFGKRRCLFSDHGETVAASASVLPVAPAEECPPEGYDGRCPECSAPFRFADYDPDAAVIRCGHCRAELPRETQ